MSDWSMILCTDQAQEATMAIRLLTEEEIPFCSKAEKGNVHISVPGEHKETAARLVSSQMQIEQLEHRFQRRLRIYEILQKLSRRV